MEEEKDQVDSEVKSDEQIDQSEGKQSEETEETAITPDKAYELAQALQKGYTITRQEMAEIRENLNTVQSALSELNKRKQEEQGGYSDEEEPLTVKKLLEMQNQEKAKKQQDDAKIDRIIDSQLADLRVQGKIKTKEDEYKLLNYAVAHKITNLDDASDRMEEVENARKEGRKEAAKGKVKEEAGSQIGTSKKTETGEQGGVPYSEMKKDMTEIARGE